MPPEVEAVCTAARVVVLVFPFWSRKLTVVVLGEADGMGLTDAVVTEAANGARALVTLGSSIDTAVLLVAVTASPRPAPWWRPAPGLRSR